MQFADCLVFSRPRKYLVLFSTDSTHFARERTWYPFALFSYKLSSSCFNFFLSSYWSLVRLSCDLSISSICSSRPYKFCLTERDLDVQYEIVNSFILSFKNSDRRGLGTSCPYSSNKSSNSLLIPTLQTCLPLFLIVPKENKGQFIMFLSHTLPPDVPASLPYCHKGAQRAVYNVPLSDTPTRRACLSSLLSQRKTKGSL